MSELQDIDGIGNSTEEKLNKMGIETVNALANASLDELQENSVRKAEKILERARKTGVMVESGETVEKQQNAASYVSTGMQEFDAILGGGLQNGYIIGLSGEPKAGKTQTALQLLASAADFTDGHSVYIETEPNRFQVDRVKSLCRKNDSYKQIHRIQAHSSDKDVNNLELQRNSYDAVMETFDDVSLVVIDSFIANFRLSGQFEDRSDLPERNTIIADHLEAIQRMSNRLECPVILTLQVMGNPDQFSGSSHDIWGPVLMDHTITHFIHVSHAKGDLREAEVKGHPGLPEKSVTMKMPEDAPIESM